MRSIRSNTGKTKSKKTLPNTHIQLKAGYVIVDVSSATGGVTYERELVSERTINAGQGQETNLSTKKTVDNLEAVSALDALVKQADYILRKHCARTIFGYFADAQKLEVIKAEIAELQAKADAVNYAARKVGCARRAYIGIVPAKLDIATPETAREIARTVRTVLGEVLAALRSGQVRKKNNTRDELHGPLLRCKNLDMLAVGPAREMIRVALDQIPEAKKEIVELLESGASPEVAGREVNLGAIDNAISWFDEETFGGSEIASDAVSRALAV